MKSNALDLYSQIEDMFDFEEAIQKLYAVFYKKLKELKPKSVLDIGCGSGDFALGLQKDGYGVVGLDLSAKMVETTKNKGVEAYCIDLCDFDGKFDAATAVFDVLNYMTTEQIGSFFECVRRILNKDGYFIADINSYYGFEDIAQGVIALQKEDRYAVVEAEFDDERLVTTMNLFSKNDDGLYSRQSGLITQYYHDAIQLAKVSKMEIVSIDEMALYSKSADKYLCVFKNSYS